MTEPLDDYDHAGHGYRLDAVLGATPEALRTTWRATQLGSDDPVVVKGFGFAEPTVGWGGYPPDQIEALEALKHPRIPRYRHHYRRSDDRGFYLVQDFRPAAKLHTGVRWPQRVAARIAEQLLEVMVYLEDRVVPPVVHRDLAPQNVLLRTPPGESEVDLLLVDFLVVQHELGALLPTSRAAGAPGFNAPEELRGAPVDARCDMYSLGMTVACLVSGVHEDAVLELRSAETLATERLPADLDPRLVEWLARITAADPNDRPHHARTALKQLRLFADELPDGVVPEPPVAPDDVEPDAVEADAVGGEAETAGKQQASTAAETPRPPTASSARSTSQKPSPVGKPTAASASATGSASPAASASAPEAPGSAAGDFAKAMGLLFGLGLLLIVLIALLE